MFYKCSKCGTTKEVKDGEKVPECCGQPMPKCKVDDKGCGCSCC